MKKIAVLIVILGLALTATSSFAWNFFDRKPVEIRDVTPAEFQYMVDMDIDIDGITDSTVRAYLTNDEFEDLSAMGYSVRWIANKAKISHDALWEATKDTRAPMGNYHTHAELTAELKAIATANPTLCRLESAGLSVQGRELWWLKISDNIKVEEDEPEFNYISSMHGDEVVGMEMCIYLIKYLLDNYGTNTQVTRLVNETEIWIMPSMNPDGTNAGSRYNANGADLNRDFPDSVSDPSNTTNGRQPETRNIMRWILKHTPTLSANFHGGDVVVSYPWDNIYSTNPDENIFIKISEAYSSHNSPMWNGNFHHGITQGADWYIIYGGMQDWRYRWNGCNEVTIELSNTKWPSDSTLSGFWNDNRDAMLAYMEQAHIGVRGLVTDAGTGAPIAAKVSVQGINHTVYTDPDVGDYHRMLLPGTYTLVFEANGYKTVTVPNVVVKSGAATRLNVNLGDDLNAQNGKIYSPVPGSVLFSSSIPLKWQTGTNAQAYWLYIGTSQGAKNIYNSGELSGATTSRTVTDLPEDGSILYVRLWTYRNQNWFYEDYTYAAQRYYRFVNRSTGNVLDINMDQYVYNYSDNGNTDKHWKIEAIGNGFYKIVNKQNNKCLSVTNSGNYQHYLRNLSDSGNLDNQWYFKSAGDGYYKILNRTNNKALDVNASSPYVFVFPDNGNTDKHWKLYKVGSNRAVFPNELTEN